MIGERMVVDTEKHNNYGHSNNAKVDINHERSCNRKRTIEDKI